MDSRAGILVEIVLISYVWHWVPECDNVYDNPNALKEITCEFKSKNRKSDKKKLKWLIVLWLLNIDLCLFDNAVSIGISLVLEFRCFFLEVFTFQACVKGKSSNCSKFFRIGL